MHRRPPGCRIAAIAFCAAIGCAAKQGIAQDGKAPAARKLDQSAGQMGAAEEPSGVAAEWLKVPVIGGGAAR